jgi:NAD+ synthase
MAKFDRNVLRLDCDRESSRIAESLRHSVRHVLKREGVVLGISGGVDSAVALAICTRAFEIDQITALLLPEMESSSDSVRLARKVCQRFGVTPKVENMTGALLGFGCYERRDRAVREAIPEYDATYRMKITLPGDLLAADSLNVYSVTGISPEGEEIKKRLRASQLRQIVAATNFKQRARAAMLFYYADLLNFAVVGTPPKNEHDLGFFVKNGDGAMDVKPLVHLYKSQVYQLASFLGVPSEIVERPPTSDTYSAGSTQQEFFFRLPHDILDLLWFAWEHGVPEAEAARELELTAEQVRLAFSDFQRKIAATDYLRKPPIGCAP